MPDFKLFSQRQPTPSLLPTMNIQSSRDGVKNNVGVSKMTQFMHSYRYLFAGLFTIIGVVLVLFYVFIRPSAGKTTEEITANIDKWFSNTSTPVRNWVGKLLLKFYTDKEGAIHTTHLPPDSTVNQFVTKLNISESIQPI